MQVGPVMIAPARTASAGSRTTICVNVMLSLILVGCGYTPQETRLGSISGESLLAVLSSDGRHLAYVEQRDQKQFVVVDGRPDSGHDYINGPQRCVGDCSAMSLKGSLTFSPDSRRLAYAARNGDKWSVVVDNREAPERDLVDKLVFSPDSKRLAYLALKEAIGTKRGSGGTTFNTNDGMLYGSNDDGAKLSAVVDGQAGPEYDVFLRDSLIFSPDSKHLAYAAGNGKKWSVVVDGQPGAEYRVVMKDSLTFSPDSRHLAYAARRDQRWSVLLDGRPGPECDGLLNGFLIFSPDSQHLAYVAQNGRKSLLVVDGRPHGEYDGVGTGSLIFSPDNKHLAYVAHNGRTSSVVLDDHAGPQYDKIVADDPVFSPDSKHLVYAAQNGQQWFVVVDGRAGPEYEGVAFANRARMMPIAMLVFSADSQHLAYVAKDRQKWFVVLDGQLGSGYDSMPETPVFSPDSKHLAFRTDHSVVVDRQAGTTYYGLGTPIFSPDSKHLAYVAENGRTSSVVVDGKAGAGYDAIIEPLTFGPNGIFGYFALRGGSLYRISYARFWLSP
jgi:hypothetical protein